MKQTAVEWLEEKLKENLKHIVINNDYVLMESIFLQAKQIEKEQIIKFTEDFVDNFVFAAYDGECYQTKEISEYYNETYKSQNDE